MGPILVLDLGLPYAVTWIIILGQAWGDVDWADLANNSYHPLDPHKKNGAGRQCEIA